jgi:hypothetical protein
MACTQRPPALLPLLSIKLLSLSLSLFFSFHSLPRSLAPSHAISFSDTPCGSIGQTQTSQRVCALLPDALSPHGEGMVLHVILMALRVSVNVDAIRHSSHVDVFEGLFESGEGLHTYLFIYLCFFCCSMAAITKVKATFVDTSNTLLVLLDWHSAVGTPVTLCV